MSNPANYDIQTVYLTQKMVPYIELPVCKRCGNLVGDMDVHDTDHTIRDNQIKDTAHRINLARHGF